MTTAGGADANDRDTAPATLGEDRSWLENQLSQQDEETQGLRSALQEKAAQVTRTEQRASALEASRRDLMAQVKESERRLLEAANGAPRVQRKILKATPPRE